MKEKDKKGIKVYFGRMYRATTDKHSAFNKAKSKAQKQEIYNNLEKELLAIEKECSIWFDNEYKKENKKHLEAIKKLIKEERMTQYVLIGLSKLFAYYPDCLKEILKECYKMPKDDDFNDFIVELSEHANKEHHIAICEQMRFLCLSTVKPSAPIISQVTQERFPLIAYELLEKHTHYIEN